MSASGRLQAPEGAGAGGADRAGTRCAVAPLPVAGRAAEGRGGVGGALSAVLDGKLRSPGRLFAWCRNKNSWDEKRDKETKHGRKQRRGLAPLRRRATGEIVPDARFRCAARSLYSEAWTNPKHVPQWWGPQGFTTTIHEMDVKPGGVWRLTMRGPDGRDYKNRIVFIEVAKPERLVYKHEPEKGSEPVSFQTTVTFTERGELNRKSPCACSSPRLRRATMW